MLVWIVQEFDPEKSSAGWVSFEVMITFQNAKVLAEEYNQELPKLKYRVVEAHCGDVKHEC